MKKKSSITCSEDGPFIVDGDCKILNSEGEEVQKKGTTFLCRCGESKMKPFCDGSHNQIDFKGTNESDSNKNRIIQYEGSEITIQYNKELCSHAAFCVSGLKQVFDSGEDPWVDPNGASADLIKSVIHKCPSGALSYVEGNVVTSDWGQDEQLIKIARNGPIYIEGNVELKNIKFAEGVSREHYSLCRCGKSKNKPFCDGCHYDIKFKAD